MARAESFSEVRSGAERRGGGCRHLDPLWPLRETFVSWLRCFPRHQLLVLNSERFFADPQTTLNKVTRFLGLEDYVQPEFQIHNGARYAPMDPAIRQELLDYFRPHNERLYELLGERFDWDQ